MTYAPRRYDARLLEALALTGGLDPAITAEDARRAAAERLVAWFGDAADWQIESVADGYHFSRADRGVTDHYVVDLPFLASAEARKLHGLAAEEAASYAKPSRLVPVKQAAAREDEDGEGQRSEGRRVGKECVRTVRARCAPYE